MEMIEKLSYFNSVRSSDLIRLHLKKTLYFNKLITIDVADFCWASARGLLIDQITIRHDFLA